VARVTSGKIVLSPEPMDLGRSVQQTLSTLADAGRLGDHHVESDMSAVWVHADRTRMAQIISNLVENAIKFTPRGGTIRVRVGQEEREALLRVEDTGVGISSELLPKVFDLFAQGAQSLDRRHGGLGIGLTLVRRLVEEHGGRVEADSEGPGRGSRFIVRLPRIDPPTAAAPDTHGGRLPHVERRRVLIIEDDADSRTMLRELLELGGHEVHEAGDGPSGLEALIRLRPDFALVDVGLPGLDGYELAQRARDQMDGGVTLIALTGYGQPEDRRRAAEAGFHRHLVKPVDPEQLLQLLGKVS
jgi:CheY-like chemotaxis protein/anti-sigma regulatory factor (Ser/Thr protein kinase)